jgi:hypothetical protein
MFFFVSSGTLDDGKGIASNASSMDHALFYALLKKHKLCAFQRDSELASILSSQNGQLSAVMMLFMMLRVPEWLTDLQNTHGDSKGGEKVGEAATPVWFYERHMILNREQQDILKNTTMDTSVWELLTDPHFQLHSLTKSHTITTLFTKQELVRCWRHIYVFALTVNGIMGLFPL